MKYTLNKGNHTGRIEIAIHLNRAYFLSVVAGPGQSSDL